MLIRAPILNPLPDGSADFIADGALAGDWYGRISFVGPWNDSLESNPERANLICPPFLDNHIHIPQHPIRGQFMKDVEPNPQGGRLIAALNRNVFPAEAKCADDSHTRQVVQAFLEDTLAHGVIGGAAYMSVHMHATRIALEMLPPTWSVGLVLMNMQCPEYLRTDESNLQRDIESLAREFGRRVIVTDRFAVSVDSPLRRKAVELARKFGLRMQTHLNEQIVEKQFVETTLYPRAGTYTDIYERDGLLAMNPILAHCVRMSTAEFACVSRRSGACIAHCPTSNILLGSGIMPLNRLFEHGIEYAICTDVGASPTTSILCEMAQFLKVHAGRSRRATPQEAFYRSTLAPARMLGLDSGSFEVGKPMTYIEVAGDLKGLRQPDEVIQTALLEMPPADHSLKMAFDQLSAAGLDRSDHLTQLEADIEQTRLRLDRKILRVVVDGKAVWQRPN